ncbi:hypothetical protein BJX64DRAFT_77816 [Aspergillus heterothallicus]
MRTCMGLGRLPRKNINYCSGHLALLPFRSGSCRRTQLSSCRYPSRFFEHHAIALSFRLVYSGGDGLGSPRNPLLCRVVILHLLRNIRIILYAVYCHVYGVRGLANHPQHLVEYSGWILKHHFFLSGPVGAAGFAVRLNFFPLLRFPRSSISNDDSSTLPRMDHHIFILSELNLDSSTFPTVDLNYGEENRLSGSYE